MSSKPAICFPDKQAIENLQTWEALQPFDATSVSVFVLAFYRTISIP
jgi:hypothetical protein